LSSDKNMVAMTLGFPKFIILIFSNALRRNVVGKSSALIPKTCTIVLIFSSAYVTGTDNFQRFPGEIKSKVTAIPQSRATSAGSA
jgi:hypothetical protein